MCLGRDANGDNVSLWLTYLVGVGLATLPCTKHSQLLPVLEVDVGVGAMGTGEPLVTSPIQVC